MTNFRVVVIGYGIQGKKRTNYLKDDLIGIVDPIAKDAQFKNIRDVPLQSYDAALVCTPNDYKYEIIHYLLSNQKHVLVEKPIVFSESQYKELELLAKKSHFYTAYNHRFEPHFISTKAHIDSGKLGRIYSCRLFYGNGTAMDVKESSWKDSGLGVIADLGSHLLDTVLFWFNDTPSFKMSAVNSFENTSPDHAIITSNGAIFITLEMSLLSWRNTFTCDIIGENGSIHIDSLCKWGPSTLTVRKRIRPSGRPLEEKTTLIQSDPTWQAEYYHFKELCVSRNFKSNVGNNKWIQKNLPPLPLDLSDQAIYQ